MIIFLSSTSSLPSLPFPPVVRGLADNTYQFVHHKAYLSRQFTFRLRTERPRGYLYHSSRHASVVGTAVWVILRSESIVHHLYYRQRFLYQHSLYLTLFFADKSRYNHASMSCGIENRLCLLRKKGFICPMAYQTHPLISIQ